MNSTLPAKTKRSVHKNCYGGVHTCHGKPVAWVTWGTRNFAYRMCQEHVNEFYESYGPVSSPLYPQYVNSFVAEALETMPDDAESEAWDE